MWLLGFWVWKVRLFEYGDVYGVTCATGSDLYSNSSPLEGLVQIAALEQNLSKLIQPMAITPSPRCHSFSMSVSACLILSYPLDYLNSLHVCILSPQSQDRV